MKIVLIHYHLRQGGVTTVIKQQIKAVAGLCDILVLTGDACGEKLDCDLIEIKGIGYDADNDQITKPEQTADLICKAIKSKWKNGCDIIHVHNPYLAKNRNFLKILNCLKNKDMNLFLQIHDFAEDGRPYAYFFEQYLNNCHHGVINQRDYQILLKAGLPKNGVHLVRNSVNTINVESAESIRGKLVLYPIRAIRRKNIGEAILVSLFFTKKEKLTITLPPNNDADIVSYQGWKDFVNENNLNVEFEAGLNHDFDSLVKSANFLLTTSISEGFGFSFLEPWTAGKFVCGRRIAGICSDFEKQGINFKGMYDQLLVPVYLFSKELLYQEIVLCIKKCSELYRIELTEFAKSFKIMIKKGFIDFGLLSEYFQKEVILNILKDKNERDKLAKKNPFLLNLGNIENKDQLITENRNRINRNYNKAKYKDTMLKIYRSVIKEKTEGRLNKQVLLSAFWEPAGFSLLKWGVYKKFGTKS